MIKTEICNQAWLTFIMLTGTFVLQIRFCWMLVSMISCWCLINWKCTRLLPIIFPSSHCALSSGMLDHFKHHRGEPPADPSSDWRQYFPRADRHPGDIDAFGHTSSDSSSSLSRKQSSRPGRRRRGRSRTRALAAPLSRSSSLCSKAAYLLSVICSPSWTARLCRCDLISERVRVEYSCFRLRWTVWRTSSD